MTTPRLASVLSALLVPGLVLQGCATLGSHHVAAKNTNRNVIEGYPGAGFVCVEPVTPASIMNKSSGSVGVNLAEGAAVTLAGGNEQSLAKIYDIGDVVLLAQTQAFQVCLARMAGELDNWGYLDELDRIRDNASDLVLAQTGGAAASKMIVYRKLVNDRDRCVSRVESEASDTKVAPSADRLAACEQYTEAAQALLALEEETAPASGGSSDGATPGTPTIPARPSSPDKPSGGQQ